MVSETSKLLSIPRYTLVNGELMQATTIKLQKTTKSQLDQFREYKNESYDEVIRKMLFIARKAKTQPTLSKEAVIAIENARKRMKAGDFLTEDEARRRLGF